MEPQTYNVRHANDEEECSIIGSCFTKTWIVLADRNNKKLKLLSHARKQTANCAITTDCDFDVEINDVCYVSETADESRVAVALDNGFQFVNVKSLDTRRLGNKKVRKHHCFGIDSRNNMIYVVDKHRLYAYNIENGEEIPDENGEDIPDENGEPRPGEIYYAGDQSDLCKVSVSHECNDNRIFIADRNSKCAIVLKHQQLEHQQLEHQQLEHQQRQPNAALLFRIEDNSLTNIRDIAFIPSDNSYGHVLILVENAAKPFVWVSLSENNGHQIRQDLTQPVTGIQHPLSLGCSQKDTIIIGGQKDNSVSKVQLTAMLAL